MLRSFAFSVSITLLLAPSSRAVDLESFFFNDASGTLLTAAANTANPGNTWFYDPVEEAIDASSVQSGSYELISGGTSGNTGFLSRFLDITPNVTNGTVYLSTTFSSWDFGAFDGATQEDIRFSILDDDTGTSGQTVVAQVQIQRNTDTQAIELLGQSFGTAGSFDIANTVDLANTQAAPFTVVLAVDLDSDSFEIFYKDGANPSQVLGLGGVSRVRDANSLRWVTDEFGVGNIPPAFTPEFANVDSVVLSDTNPLTDLVTLQVDRVTGAMSLVNNSGAAVTGITGVTLESAGGSLDLTDFVDFTGTLSDGQTAGLDSSPGSAPGLWIKNPVEDIRAELATTGGVRTLDVDFVNNGGVKWLVGDLDFDGAIDADDYTILTTNAETTLTGTVAENYQLGDLNGDGFNNVIDFGLFKDDFIAANGAAAFANLLAGIPEPGSAALALTGLSLILGIRRRRCQAAAPPTHRPKSLPMTSRNPMPILALAAVTLLSAARLTEAQSVLLHDFQFGETAGTDILNLTDSAGAAFFREVDDDNVDVVTNGLGQLDLSTKSNDNFGSNNLFDITTPITEGVVFGVLEATWDFQSTLNTAENEQLRLSIINEGNSFVTAEIEIERTDADELFIGGQQSGSGTNTPVAQLNGGSLTQTDNFVAVVQADLTADTYTIFYSNDDFSSFNEVGSGALDPARGATSIRLVMNNDFANDNVLVDRVRFFQNELPFELDPTPPEVLTLQVDPISGYAGIVNATTGETFDVDYYLVESSDGSLLEGGWNSLENQEYDAVDGPDAGTTAGDGVGETWTEAGGSDQDVLSEQFLLSSSVFDSGEAVSLGAILGGNADAETLSFEYRDPTTGDVTIGDVVVAELLPGDFNVDGRVDAADYLVLRENASGLFTATERTVWETNYGSVYTPASSVSIPEPSTLGMIVAAVGWCGRGARRSAGRR